MWRSRHCLPQEAIAGGHPSLSARGLYCRSQPCDLVHVHAIGPGLVVPLLRLLGKKVVFTHHGPDYDRQKWGRLAKWVLRLGERWAVRYANEVIVISEVINDAIRREYDRQDAHLIYNGVRPVELPGPEAIGMTLGHFGLAPGGYLVAVGRFVEEKGCTISLPPIASWIPSWCWCWWVMPITRPLTANA